MDWFEDVCDCARRRNEIWFRRTNEIILELDSILSTKSRRTIVLWSLNMANDVRNKLTHYAFIYKRPENAINVATDWAFGRDTMRNARKAILQCHSACKEDYCETDNLYMHAIGQACSTVHTPKHATGLPVYELTAIAKLYGLDQCNDKILSRVDFYIERLNFCETQVDQYADWAHFM